MALGHDIRMITPQYVRPCVKRQKNDSAGAEAASRPSMRFVAVKNSEQQGYASAASTGKGQTFDHPFSGPFLCNALRGSR